MTDLAFETAQQPAEPVEAQVVDIDTHAPAGLLCEACGSPLEAADRFCPACGSPQDRSQQSSNQRSPSTEQRYLRCETCGSEVAMDSDQRSYVCAFCDSTYVVEFAPEQSGRQRPEFVIGFSITPEQAESKFHQWLHSNSWFRPGDLRAARIAEKLKGIYMPFWSFSMLAQSSWQASIGEYWYRTETYTTTDSKGKTVTRTRRVRETEWWPLSGNHHRYYSGYMISASRGLSQADAERIKPFQLPALKRYQPYYLAGWLCEEYSKSKEEALALCQQEFHRREQNNVAAFLPGDTHRSLQVRSRFSDVNSDLCLLPIYVLSYRYKDKLYRFLVNGQTGKVAGDKPCSWMRIGLAIGGGLLLLALIGLIVALLAGGV